MRPPLEVADIFRQCGNDFRLTHTLSPEQRRVMRAIERCRTAALGGHVEQCDTCGHQRHGYEWFVISALHGLVTPNQTIAPYNYSLKQRRGARERESWAYLAISAHLTNHVAKGSHAFLIMPELYRRYIQHELDRQSIRYTNPLQHLAIGEQMRWLDSN